MSLLMVRKSAPAHAADKTENIAQDSEIVALWQVLGDAKAYLREGKKNHNVKNVLAAAIKAAEKENPNDRSVLEAKKVLAQFDAGNFKVYAKDAAPKPGDKVFWRNGPLKFEGVFVKSQGGRNLVKTDHGEIWVYSNVYLEGQKPTYRDTPFGRFYDSSEMSLSSDSAAADADKSEELEREIKGDVVAVVSGNAARVSKDVSFATAKEGVESFARKNGVSVVASQEYGEAYKFKFSAAIDSAAGSAQDAGVPNDLAFAVGAIENAIEKYSKTFSRYEDNLEGKDFKRYNAIFHAAVNMHRAIQSA